MARMFRKIGLVGALVGSMAFMACGSMGTGKSTQTWTMTTAQSIPAAVGKVKVAAQKDGNVDVKVQVEHMAMADNVTPETATYVVWIKPENGAPQNVGILEVDKNAKGSFETKTPFKEFTILVTAETSSAATAPTGQTMMDARVTVPI